jgi:hypothetical protein
MSGLWHAIKHFETALTMNLCWALMRLCSLGAPYLLVYMRCELAYRCQCVSRSAVWYRAVYVCAMLFEYAQPHS